MRKYSFFSRSDGSAMMSDTARRRRGEKRRQQVVGDVQREQRRW
jgi:hypothetical protein